MERLNLPHPMLRPWRELAMLSGILMELSWVALFYRVLFPTGRAVSYERALLVLAGILFVPYLITRWSETLDLNMRLRQGLLAGSFVFSALAGLKVLARDYRFTGFHLQEFFSRPASTMADIVQLVPVEFLLLVVIFLAWWRGISLASKPVGPASVMTGFRVGIAGFFIYGLALPLVGEAPVWLALSVFLFSSLLALSSARIAVLVHLRGGQRIPFNRKWLAGIFTVVLGVALLVNLAVWIVREGAFESIVRLFSWLVYLIAILLGPLLLLFMRLIFRIGEGINFSRAFSSVISLLQSIQETFQKWIQAIEKMFSDARLPVFQPLLEAIYVLRFLIFWGAILFGVLLVLLTLQRRVWKQGIEGDQGFEAIQGEGTLGELLRSILRRSFSRMAGNLGNTLRVRRPGEILAAARIRQIYARLLNLSARLDRPRPASSTPLEFLPNLEALFPGMKTDLVTITRAYLRVRYGELSETLQEVEAVEAAWSRIALEGKARLAEQRRKKRLVHG